MKSQTESLEHASVRQYCKAVRVPVIGANFLSLAEQAVKEKHSHIRYLEALLAMECDERDRHAINNRIRDAQLPRMKTLEEFDFAQAPQISERANRDIALGRGNWTFFGSDNGGKTAAVLRSFIASCKRCDVEPFAWFRDVLSRIPAHSISRLTELIPHNWKPATSPAQA
jgi:hypothetical protein